MVPPQATVYASMSLAKSNHLTNKLLFCRFRKIAYLCKLKKNTDKYEI